MSELQHIWDPRQGAARLVSEADDVFHLEGVRWGFDEHGPYDEWVGRFGDAIVDAKRVAHVWICIEPFPPEWLAAHAFLSFEMHPDAPVRNQRGDTDSALVISAEAHLHKGEAFDLFAGMRRAYPLMYQVGTWSDVVLKTCRGEGHKIVRHRLELRPDQMRDMLVSAIRRATSGRVQPYNTVTNSCLTSAIHEINAALPMRQRVWSWLIPFVLPNLAAALPRTAAIVLTARHALSDAPCVLTQPEVSRYPDSQARLTALGRLARGASEHRAWRSGLRLTGLALGLLATRNRGGFGRLAGAVVGQLIGRVTADVVRAQVHTRMEPSEPYLERFS